MPDSQNPKQVNNNDLRNAQFGGGFINAETVNAGQIGGDIYNIQLGQQQVTSDSPAPSSNQQQRSQQERDSLEKVYTQQRQKVERIRNVWVIETDPSRKFQYEQQLQEEERILKELGEKLVAIEKQIEAARNKEKKADSYFEQEPDEPIFPEYNIADIIEKLKNTKPETIVNSCSTHQEAIGIAHDLWNEGTKIAKEGQLSEAVFLLEFGISIAKILDNIILWLAIDKDLEFIKAKLH